MRGARYLYAGFALIVYSTLAGAPPAWAEPGREADPSVSRPDPNNAKRAQQPALSTPRDDSQAACFAQNNAIRIKVKDVRSGQGTITADLHGERPEEFLKKKKKILRVRVPARIGQVELCLPAPDSGVFAVGLYHDRNANKRFDKDVFGLPAEPYGVSNNPRILFGPPKHQDAAFTVGPEGTALEIVLRH